MMTIFNCIYIRNNDKPFPLLQKKDNIGLIFLQIEEKFIKDLYSNLHSATPQQLSTAEN